MALSGAGEFSPIIWTGDSVRLIDQTRLPMEEVWVEISNYREIVEAIRGMMVRGAPAIGIAGAYGLALAAMELSRAANGGFSDELDRAAIEIKTARPTGANLAWAVDRLLCAARNAQSVEEVITDLTSEAVKIHKEDLDFNHAIGRNGARLIPWGSQVLTHCNAGALATGGYGTALGVIRTAWSDQRIERVFATETRPLLQGARLTAWELAQAGIPTSLVSDSSAGQLMKKGMVQAVFVGADRIAANGDVANKIGTYTLAVLAKETGVPFYVAAPTSTLDMSLSSGDEIPIE
ncbi:MAG: S-methyl-5-thioribose-1-phosphate isomerase, partial [Chloroflexi bacterium]|nr:S-methyl-5-thioribose-1-phosphate isomerase [Chloroflexota bacterium]